MKIPMTALLALGLAAPLAWGNTGGKTATKMEVPSTNLAAQKIRDELKHDTTLSSGAQNLRVTAEKDALTVSGIVATEAEKDKVEAVARQFAGTNKVNIDIIVE